MPGVQSLPGSTEDLPKSRRRCTPKMSDMDSAAGAATAKQQDAALLQRYLGAGGDPNRCQSATTLLYHAARCGDAQRVHMLLQAGAQASLLVRGPNGNYPLHAAALARAPACIALLLDAHAAIDPRFDACAQKNSAGDSPLDSAASDAETLRAFDTWSPLRDAGPMTTVLGPPCYPQRTDKSSLVHTLSTSPLIGNRNLPFSRQAVPVDSIAESILQEEQACVQEDAAYAAWLELRGQWISKEIKGSESVVWRCHVPGAAMVEDLRHAWDTGSDGHLFRKAISLYTAQSFLSKGLRTATHARDDAKKHCAPILKLLHGALRSFPIEHRHCAAGYRSVSLSETEYGHYAAPPADGSPNFFSLDGFMSVTMSAEVAVGRPVEWNCNALLVVTPADPADPNCCPVRVAEMSACPQEAEALYPLGQQFRVTNTSTKTLEQVAEWLSVQLPSEAAPALQKTIFVIEMHAVDVFWEMADDVFKNGVNTQEAFDAMKAKCDADVATYGAHDCRVAQGLFHMGRVLHCMANRLPHGPHSTPQRITKHSAAVDSLQRSLGIRKAALGDDHPDVVATYTELASVYVSQGEPDKALDIFHSRLDRERAALGDDHLSVALTYSELASVYSSKGQHTAALDKYQRCLDIRTAALGNAHPDVINIWGKIAAVYAAMLA